MEGLWNLGGATTITKQWINENSLKDLVKAPIMAQMWVNDMPSYLRKVAMHSS